MTMIEFLKRAISGLFIIILIFSTILFSSTFFIITMIASILEIWFFEWPNFEKKYRHLFFIYPLIPFSLIIYLQLTGYKKLNLLIFSSSFIFDSTAYVFGKLFGRHKIVPKISSGKTIEGTIGGLVTLILSYLAYLKFGLNYSLQELLEIKNFLIPITISFLAFFGDLFESYLKRKSGLKDSGNILPGHGGLLDRFDSILFVAVFVFLLRNYLIKIL